LGKLETPFTPEVAVLVAMSMEVGRLLVEREEAAAEVSAVRRPLFLLLMVVQVQQTPAEVAAALAARTAIPLSPAARAAAG
jgi:hypothetical protein